MISTFPKEVLVEIYRWLPIRDQANWHLLCRRLYEILPPLLTEEDKKIIASHEWVALCKDESEFHWRQVIFLCTALNNVKILRVVANYSFINLRRCEALGAAFAHAGYYGNTKVGQCIITLFEGVDINESVKNWFGAGLSNAYYSKKMDFYNDLKQQLCLRLKLNFPIPQN